MWSHGWTLISHISQERKEAESWKDKDVKGGKAKAEEKEEKRKAELARKAENARLLAEEEAAASSKVKAAPKAGAKKKADVKPAGPGAIAAGGGIADGSGERPPTGSEPAAAVESFAATGIDNALDLLEVVTAKMDKASVGQQAAGIERHPEVFIYSFTFRILDDLNIFYFSNSPASFQGKIIGPTDVHCLPIIILYCSL